MCLGCCCCRVKQGGPDPVANSKLSDLLKQAKDLGVPKDIIERNIKKASDAKQGDFQECMCVTGRRGSSCMQQDV